MFSPTRGGGFGRQLVAGVALGPCLVPPAAALALWPALRYQVVAWLGGVAQFWCFCWAGDTSALLIPALVHVSLLALLHAECPS
jgi:hypothetical protein